MRRAGSESYPYLTGAGGPAAGWVRHRLNRFLRSHRRAGVLTHRVTPTASEPLYKVRILFFGRTLER